MSRTHARLMANPMIDFHALFFVSILSVHQLGESHSSHPRWCGRSTIRAGHISKARTSTQDHHKDKQVRGTVGRQSRQPIVLSKTVQSITQKRRSFFRYRTRTTRIRRLFFVCCLLFAIRFFFLLLLVRVLSVAVGRA